MPASIKNISELAAIIGETERQVYLLAKEGVVPPAIDGAYDIQKSTAAYITYLKQRRDVVNARELGRILGVTDQAVYRMAREGMPVAKRGKYHVPTCVQWNRERWREIADGKGSREAHDERRLLLREQRLKAEMERRQMEGGLIEIDQAILATRGLVAEFTQGLTSLPSHAAQKVVGRQNAPEIREILKRECNQVRDAIARRLQQVIAKIA